MVDQTVIEAAKDAFLKIDNEDQRRSFIDWCRRETDKMFFSDVRKATDEGIGELKESLGKTSEVAKKVGTAAVGAGRVAVEGIKTSGDKLGNAMKDFLGKKEEEA